MPSFFTLSSLLTACALRGLVLSRLVLSRWSCLLSLQPWHLHPEPTLTLLPCLLPLSRCCHFPPHLTSFGLVVSYNTSCLKVHPSSRFPFQRTADSSLPQSDVFRHPQCNTGPLYVLPPNQRTPGCRMSSEDVYTQREEDRRHHRRRR